jgi:pimeloyl-ACP methyl ester carboxylesterase
MDALADWHARLMDTLGIPRAHVAGNSMGCQVALALARRHPERVVGLVLVGPTLGTGSIAFSRYVAGLLADVFLETMLYNGTLLRMYCQMGTRRYLATVRKMMEDDPLAQAGSVRAPCLILRGGRDVIIPDAEARQLAARLPNGTFLEIPKTAHAVQFNAPDRFVGAALPFWERAEIASAAKVRASRAERTSDAPDVTSRQIIP